MTVIDVLALPVESAPDLSAGGPDRYDYSRLPEHLRPAAMTAQGTVVEGLTSAVRRVLDAGQALAWAKAELPRGEYLPWVQQACGLKPRYAQQLVKAAEWASNAQSIAHLHDTSIETLFILSADTTTEEVREWFMQRCAAGDPPTRKEVQERKRSAGQPRQPQPTEALALSIIRKGELERIREAIALAERAQLVTAADVMAEQRLRDLGKQRFIPGADADFHRMKDGSWVRLPHATTPQPASDPEPEPVHQPQIAIQQITPQPNGELMTVERAAEMIGVTRPSLSQLLTPSASEMRGGPLIRKGLVITREKRGLVRVKPVGI